MTIDKETILRIARESGAAFDLLAMGRHDGVLFTAFELERFAAALLTNSAESCAEVPEPQPVNESGSTMTVTRWMVETPHGWVGAWDKSAITGLLTDYGNARAAEALERAAERCEGMDCLSTPFNCADAIRSLTP